MVRKIADSVVILLFAPFFGMMFGGIFGAVLFLPALFILPLFGDVGSVFDSYANWTLWIGAAVGAISGMVYVYETYWSN